MTAKCPKNPQTSQTGCKKYEFKCDSQECMPTDVLCDGKIDCRDGSDENIEHCAAISCPSYAFRCGYGILDASNGIKNKMNIKIQIYYTISNL